MICYRDKTFCVNPNCTCGHKLTKEIVAQAEQWMENAPIAFADRCGNLTEEEINQEFTKIMKEYNNEQTNTQR